MKKDLRIALIGAGAAGLIGIVAGMTTAQNIVLFRVLLAITVTGALALYWQLLIWVLRRANPGQDDEAQPAQPQPRLGQPYVLSDPAPPEPADVRTQTFPYGRSTAPLQPAPPYVRTRTLPLDPTTPPSILGAPRPFTTPSGASIFDANGVYRAPNQPTCDLLTTDPLPPLEPEPTNWTQQQDIPSPWDDQPVTLPTVPLHAGPLLRRRLAKPGEYDLIRGIHAETGSLNATIRRVYGAKDSKTHAWTKQALGE